MRLLAGFVILAVALPACGKHDSAPTERVSTPAPASASVSAAPLPAAVEPSASASAAAPAASAPASETAAAPASCPTGMLSIPGGIFWMGSDGTNDEESPRHRVAIRPFCMDETEITVRAYKACVDAGGCTPAHPEKTWCNAARAGKEEHPVNCIDWDQATTACTWAKARLPSEREWEYAARGGAEQRPFSWGSELPPGHSCYNHEGTCPVKSYAPGAFGLHDVTGNLWEWTASTFGKYPGEAPEGTLKVYRGGSFSRRFPKWMRNALRNRYRKDEWGAHLGARCAADLPGAACPDGSHAAETGRDCVVDGEAPRAAVPRAPGGPVAAASGAPTVASEKKPDPSTEPVTKTRDTTFDDDCRKYKPGRPTSYMIRGGQFADRQKAKGGCVNRDVGVGFNSVCCPD